MNTYLFTILNELILDILTTIFTLEDFEFPPRLVFNQASKDFEEVKKFRLVAAATFSQNSKKFWDPPFA